MNAVMKTEKDFAVSIFTEAGLGAGFGHLSRCLALAQEMKVDCKLFVQSDSKLPSNPQFCVTNWRSDIRKCKRLLKENPGIAVFDSYLITQEFLNDVKAETNVLVCIDDFERIVYPSDLILNPSILGPEYRTQNCQIIQGAEYALLNSNLRAVEPKLSHGNLNKILLTFGGLDKIEFLDRTLSKLSASHYDFIALSGTDTRARYLRQKYPLSPVKIKGRLDFQSTVEVFKNVDLAISAGGQTLYELAYLGVPFIAMETACDQFWNVKGFVASGVTPKHFRPQNKCQIDELMDAIISFRDVQKRYEMAKLGREKIDGHGSQRVARILEHKLRVL